MMRHESAHLADLVAENTDMEQELQKLKGMVKDALLRREKKRMPAK